MRFALDRRSNRRQTLDTLLKMWSPHFIGTVLEIGGSTRGHFVPPNAVDHWIVADIVPSSEVAVVLDIAQMGCIRSNTIGAIKVAEVFEHVIDPVRGLKECYRILRPGGFMFLTVPFLHRVHADPTDMQRWTADKWHEELAAAGFQVEVFEVIGRFFSLAGDLGKVFIRTLPRPVRRVAMILGFPLLSRVGRLDNTRWARRHSLLMTYHTGYFAALRKPTAP